MCIRDSLNMLGKRETDIYGTRTLDQITSDLEKKINDKSLSLDFFQSNHEGEILDFMHKNNNKVDGCIINAGALTHSSTALHDAIKSVDFPCVEVHMSNIYSRKESWRQKSLIAPAVIGTVQGFGEESYKAALELLVQYIRN